MRLTRQLESGGLILSPSFILLFFYSGKTFLKSHSSHINEILNPILFSSFFLYFFFVFLNPILKLTMPVPSEADCQVISQ